MFSKLAKETSAESGLDIPARWRGHLTYTKDTDSETLWRHCHVSVSAQLLVQVVCTPKMYVLTRSWLVLLVFLYPSGRILVYIEQGLPTYSMLVQNGTRFLLLSRFFFAVTRSASLWKKVNESHYRPEVPRGLQEVKVPRLRENGPGWW